MRARAIVSGKVQGVGFRAWTRQQAHLLGLSGWVRNLPDGRVEALFEGAGKELLEMRKRLSTGPILAKVSGVEWRSVEEQEPVSGFEIKR